MTLPRSDHFNGKTFHQAHHATSGKWSALLRWKLASRPAPWPSRVTTSPQPPPPRPQGDAVVATWVGHATFLLQSRAGNLLTDPVFSERTSPVAWAGPRRVHPPGVPLEALPRIDSVLLSHDHYDHCDLASLARLAAMHRPVFIAPLRHRDLLHRAGARDIVELDWWQTHRAGPVEVTLTPTKHWSNRFGTPRNHRLWGGFYLAIKPAATGSDRGTSSGGTRRIWFVGDTGFEADMFQAVHDRLGQPDLALVPIGAYEPRWFMEPMHINPAEAVKLHQIVHARLSVGMHWGTFQLTDEAREAPLAALDAARRQAGIAPESFRVLSPGESVVV